MVRRGLGLELTRVARDCCELVAEKHDFETGDQGAIARADGVKPIFRIQ